MTALARWRGSLEVLRHSTGWRRHLRSQVLSVSPRGTSRVRRCIQARRSEGTLGGERGACCAGTVARKGQATRAARTDPSTIFHRVVKLGPWVSEENGRVPGPSERTWGRWASRAPAGLLPALSRQRGRSPAGGGGGGGGGGGDDSPVAGPGVQRVCAQCSGSVRNLPEPRRSARAPAAPALRALKSHFAPMCVIQPQFPRLSVWTQ